MPAAEPVRADSLPGVDDPALIAVILPRSGPVYLEQYADLLLEGVRMAAREQEREVRLLVLDDRGMATRDSALVQEAIDSGAVAVIGPILSAGVVEAVKGRSLHTLLIVSPTAAQLPAGAADVYTLNGTDLRGPRALAEYVMAGSLTTASVIYPTDEILSRQAWEFARAFQELGGRVAAMVPFDSGTTTFGTHIGRVVDSRPDVVYLPLSPLDIEVMAPQLAYYGLRRRGSTVVLLGNEAWTDAEVLRVVGAQFTDGVVLSTPNPQLPGETGWDEFMRAYEQLYRRALDNPFPALGYDAMRLILHALDDGANTPSRVAERFAGTRAFRGATGVLSVEGGQITRAPFIYRLHQVRLTPAPPAEQLRLPPGGGPIDEATSPPQEFPR